MRHYALILDLPEKAEIVDRFSWHEPFDVLQTIEHEHRHPDDLPGVDPHVAKRGHEITRLMIAEEVPILIEKLFLRQQMRDPMQRIRRLAENVQVVRYDLRNGVTHGDQHVEFVEAVQDWAVDVRFDEIFLREQVAQLLTPFGKTQIACHVA